MESTKKIYEYAEKISMRLGMEDVELNTDEDVIAFIANNQKEYIRMKTMDYLIDKAELFAKKLNKQCSVEFLNLVLSFSRNNKGIYIFYSGNDVVYVGKSFCLSNRVFSSFLEKEKLLYSVDGILVIQMESNSDINIAEPYIISKTNPRINKEFTTFDSPILFSCEPIDKVLSKYKPIPIFLEKTGVKL